MESCTRWGSRRVPSTSATSTGSKRCGSPRSQRERVEAGPRLVTATRDPNEELCLQPGWWARLVGEKLDLEGLCEALGDRSPVQIRQVNGHYYLRMEEFDRLNESADVETRASEVLRIANGAARVQYCDSREVRVDAVARVEPNGQIQHFVHLSVGICARGRVSATLTVNGEPVRAAPEPTIAERAVAAALNDSQAERALRIFGRDGVDYRELYHVLEIAEAAIGSRIYSDGAVTQAEVRRFKHTANSVHALGEQARHGHEATQPPAEPMSFADAQALVGRVLRVWFAATS